MPKLDCIASRLSERLRISQNLVYEITDMAKGVGLLVGAQPGFKLRMIGTAAPVFPGYEVDICDRVSDSDKPDAVWHRERARKIVAAHPEIKSLMGNSPSTAFWCLLVAGAQIGVALAASWAPWWGMLLMAYTLGPWLNICLFELAHQCNHNLVFKKTSWNRWLFTITSLPMFLSGHHTWWVEHLVHHNDMGAKKDFISRRRSFFLLTRRSSPLFIPYSLTMLVMQVLRSTLGLIMYLGSLVRGRTEPGNKALVVLTDEHLASGYRKNGITRWAAAYPLLSLLMTAGVFAVGGWKSVAYLLLAQAFMTGFLHPLMFGVVLSISHFYGHGRYQPTASYYGWWNKITFDLGLHTEHHDLAGIPWHKLYRLRQIAPEFYDDLAVIKSYSALGLKFILASTAECEARFANEDKRGNAA